MMGITHKSASGTWTVQEHRKDFFLAVEKKAVREEQQISSKANTSFIKPEEICETTLLILENNVDYKA